MAAKHIPTSSLLAGLTILELIFTIAELGVLAYLQTATNNGTMGFLSTYRVLGASLGTGIFTACVSIIFVVYFLVTTTAATRAYHKIAASVLALTSLIFWVITFILLCFVMSQQGQVTWLPAWYNPVSDGHTDYETLGANISNAVWNSTITFAGILWVLFLISTFLLVRAPAQSASQTNVPEKFIDVESIDERSINEKSLNEKPVNEKTLSGDEKEKSLA